MNQKEQVLGPLARALAVLRFVAANRRPATAAEIAAALKLPLPTAHRLIANLEALGYLSRPVGEKGIVPGPELVGLSADAFVFAFAGSGVNAVLRKACDAIGEQCEITVGRRGYMEYLATAKVDMAAGLQFDAGRRSPLHCTSSGKLYLSTLDDAALAKLVPTLPLERFTAHTVTEPEELIRQVHEARRNGFAKSNEEYVAG
ncbi:MAG: helix-turn-helix domain-containing protein, partial [Methylobacteriaceae bacterium]|nr:helix-turn-helix domain-containing protein [Methylobacteriaceae bacterium]